ncbi:MAG: hypothetical protein KFE20_00195 [Candidatus Sulcia muelleri]|nr:hypothetical protein [Candidatus Karelsulcia muelleri]
MTRFYIYTDGPIAHLVLVVAMAIPVVVVAASVSVGVTTLVSGGTLGNIRISINMPDTYTFILMNNLK